MIKKLALIGLVALVCLLMVNPAQAGHTGPLWAVWTHSTVPWQCAVKTGFWWIGGWCLAIYLYDRHIRETPTTKADVLRHMQDREKQGPNR